MCDQEKKVIFFILVKFMWYVNLKFLFFRGVRFKMEEQ